ncbi:hypothetical protein MHU86_23542 [Fragilaria crotonensis]|nr:hypothetical protein MHU86_23542 [Fragilaria crotonensis]
MSSKVANPKKDTYGTGMPDLKSLGLNIATTLLLLLPFALYFDRASDRSSIYVAVVVVTFILAVLIPPWAGGVLILTQISLRIEDEHREATRHTERIN